LPLPFVDPLTGMGSLLHNSTLPLARCYPVVSSTASTVSLLHTPVSRIRSETLYADRLLSPRWPLSPPPVLLPCPSNLLLVLCIETTSEIRFFRSVSPSGLVWRCLVTFHRIRRVLFTFPEKFGGVLNLMISANLIVCVTCAPGPPAWVPCLLAVWFTVPDILDWLPQPFAASVLWGPWRVASSWHIKFTAPISPFSLSDSVSGKRLYETSVPSLPSETDSVTR
jgi:hypothetical protein